MVSDVVAYDMARYMADVHALATAGQDRIRCDQVSSVRGCDRLKAAAPAAQRSCSGVLRGTGTAVTLFCGLPSISLSL